MSRPMVTLLLLVACAASHAASARTLQARIERVTTAVATLDRVQVRLDWPADATQGELFLTAGSVDAPDLGYHYRDLAWRCPLRREAGHWRCDGPVRGVRGEPLRLAVDLGATRTHATLNRGAATLAVDRQASTPDDTTIDITRVPLAWAQALLSRAWESGRLKSGTLDGALRVHAPTAQPLSVTGTLAIAGAAFETPDATIAGESLAGRFAIDYRKTPRRTTVTVDGPLRGGEFLAGNAYVALPSTPVGLHVEATQDLGSGWRIPVFGWRDGSVLDAQGSAAFATDSSLQSLDVHAHSADVAPLGARYLSGWLAVAGLADLKLSGAADVGARIDHGALQSANVALHGVDMADAKGRFRFDRLDGSGAFSATAPVASALHWSGGQLYDLDFGAATLPIASSQGELRLAAPVTVPALGGSLRFDGMTLRPPAGDAGADIRFGLTLDRLDIGRLAKALSWPAFQGQLSGRIPNARYAAERLQFDGGLTMQVFGGMVQASSLAMERPFGVAPSLSADLVLDNIDLQSLTGVFDFGSITGRLAGRIDALRLVDWSATAFDAELHTVKTRGVKQRISQRAVQNISSVGDASFTSTLQSQLIGLFKDFGYSRIGISCRLANEVCAMGGLEGADTSGSEAGGFTIVEGAGIPHLTVVGFHRSVDWPTLVERLAAASKGDVKPVVE
ncbi:MAG TPA: hypothetical protein VHL61_09945 [Luteimonas sp.]|nr:hypothetical protein [Luteimonas sp.]